MKPQPQRDSKQLADAFALFSEMSGELASTYRLLEDRVARLSRELAEARNERHRQLAEKERLANRLALLLEALPGVTDPSASKTVGSRASFSTVDP